LDPSISGASNSATGMSTPAGPVVMKKHIIGEVSDNREALWKKESDRSGHKVSKYLFLKNVLPSFLKATADPKTSKGKSPGSHKSKMANKPFPKLSEYFIFNPKSLISFRSLSLTFNIHYLGK
jgi:hypothetical protein